MYEIPENPGFFYGEVDIYRVFCEIQYFFAKVYRFFPNFSSKNRSMELNSAKYQPDSAKKKSLNSANWKLSLIFSSNFVHILVKKLPSFILDRVLYFKYVKYCTNILKSTIG